jgi:hypothetical protein
MTNFISFFDAHGNELDSVPFIATTNAAEKIDSIVSDSHARAVRFEIEDEEGFVYHRGECL